LHFELATQYTH